MDYIMIEPNSTVKEVQETFRSYYPNLKIEFYKNWHNPRESSSINEQQEANKTLHDLNPNIKKNIINLSEYLTVQTIESEFEELDLHIQVFGKSDGAWLQTTTADNKVLASLNKESSPDNNK